MKNVISFKHAILLAIAVLVFASSPSQSNAQSTNVYKRSAVVEEFTGTWCGYCPRGAWFMDSLQDHMGDNVVEICWHNNYSIPGNTDPNSGGDPLTIDLDQTNKVEDTVEGYFGVNSFPSIGIQRTGAGGVNDWSNGDPNYTAIKNICKQAPLADVRVVNVGYDASAHTVNLDLDITPFDMSKMPSDDTEKYVTICVMTEDNLAADQHNYALRGLPEWLTGFIHQNVARAVSGKVVGNPFTLGTKQASPTLPARIHYSFNIDPANWNASYLRVKTVFDGINQITVSGKKYDNNVVFNAAQTGYLTSYPQTPPNAVWIVLPSTNYSTKLGASTNIVWATGGNASAAVKLEWSGDNGASWNTIVSSTTNSPYPWTIPQAAYGDSVTIRVSDASNINTKSTAGKFATPGIITITHPSAGEVLVSGTSDSIVFTGGNIGAPKKIEYSLDSGATWTLSNNITTDLKTLTWMVPTTTTTTTAAYVRVTDGNGIVGKSAQFTIQGVAGTKASINTVSIKYILADSIAVGTKTTISWTTTGNVGSTISLDYAITDPGITWTHIATINSDQTSYAWTVPNDITPTMLVRVSGSDQTAASATFGPFKVYGTAGVYSPVSFNGYSLANYPNPFVGETKIAFVMPERGLALITLHDELGRTVATVANSTFESGSHEISFDGAKLPAGVYTCTFEVNGVRLVKQMSLVK
ncbi:MAG TPA: hypothetical protein VEW28_03215 [Candidatus Kapabacteria bacterium]|nr:hypothetical protein [Candidatus Kapabacteria bacterium]